MSQRKGVWRGEGTSGSLRVTRRGWCIMILLVPLCSNVNVYGFLHSSSSLDSSVIDRCASKEVVTREDIKERMASSERAGKFSNIEHHGVAASSAASRYSTSPRPSLIQRRQCLHVSELRRLTSSRPNNASERVAMHASR